jgi:hypothetical protein
MLLPGVHVPVASDFDYNLPTATYWQAHCTNILPYGCKIYRFPVTTGNTYTFKTGCGDGATADFNTSWSCSTATVLPSH